MGVKLILITAFFLLLPIQVLAQENDGLKGYTPPPMFGAPRPVPPKKKKAAPPKLPPISQPPSNTPVVVSPPAVVSKQPAIPLRKPPHPKEKFEKKKEVKPLEPQLEPIDLLPSKKEKEPVKSEGVVKGPKTMPSSKKAPVETEVLYESAIQNPIATIERTQKEEAKETDNKKPSPMPLDPDYPLPKIKEVENGLRQLNIIFSEGQNGLAKEQIYTLENLIVPFLKEDDAHRVRLESYASHQDSTLSGDRRMALSRAMLMRQYILDQGISPSRLDVRSLGAQTDIQPLDRIELFLVN